MQRRRFPFLIVAAIALATSTPLPAGSATATSNLSVQLQITSSCTVDTSSALSFPSSGVLAAVVDAATTFTVTCTDSTPYTISIGPGSGSGATTVLRKMTSAALATVNYGLYSNAARTTVWGNLVGINTVGGTGTGSAQTYDLYGRVLVQLTPAAGVFTDTVAVTVTY